MQVREHPVSTRVGVSSSSTWVRILALYSGVCSGWFCVSVPLVGGFVWAFFSPTRDGPSFLSVFSFPSPSPSCCRIGGTALLRRLLGRRRIGPWYHPVRRRSRPPSPT